MIPMKQFNLNAKYFIVLLVCLATHIQLKAQSSGSITVDGDFDKFYPVVWTDGNWSNNKQTTLFIGRSSVHLNSSWRGSVISQFNFHLTNWGNGSHFIDGFVRYGTVPFIAGWRDASGNSSDRVMIVWMRGGGTTYHYSTVDAVAVDPVVYDGVANSLPFNETSGPSHSYKTSVDPYVNSNGWSFPLSMSIQENLSVAGNVGIGGITPNKQLEIGVPNGTANGIRIGYNGNTSEGFDLQYLNTGNSKSYIDSRYDNEGAAMQFRMRTNGTPVDALTILGNGYVGIGTTLPAVELDVNGSINLADGNNLTWGGVYSSGKPTISANPTVGLVFYPTGSTSGEKVRILPSGNVGIGTGSPNGLYSGDNKTLHLNAPTNFTSEFVQSNNQGSITHYLAGTIAKAGMYSAAALAYDIELNGASRFFISTTGKIGIGTNTPQSELAVNGVIYAKKVKVTQTGWPDYVFAKEYSLKPLSEVEAYILKFKHLPEVPSAEEVEKNDLDLGEMNKILLMKVEELTLYIIVLQKEAISKNKELAERIHILEQTLKSSSPK